MILKLAEAAYSVEIAICFALALFLSTALVPVAIRYAPALGLVDLPDGDRKIHLNPIPRCGGLAIITAVLCSVLFWLDDLSQFYNLFIGSLTIALFGFLDDRYDLNYKWKFLGQIIAVGIFLMGSVEVTKTPFLGLGNSAPILSYAVMSLFILGVTNAVNLTDGLDGLAAGSSLLGLGFIAYLSVLAGDFSITLIVAAVVGSILGFLRFNTHPANVFMGDAGSQFLGFLAACLAILVTQSEASAVSPSLAVLIVGMPILDTLMVMTLRMKEGRSPFYPDRRHIHHQLLDLGLAHYHAVGVLYLLNFSLLFIAYTFRFESDAIVLTSYVIFSMATLTAIKLLSGSELLRQRRLLNAKRDRRNGLLRKASWVYEYGPVALQYVLGVTWLALLFSIGPQDTSLGIISLTAIILILVTFRYQDTYRLIPRAILYLASILSVFTGVYQTMALSVNVGFEILWVDFFLLMIVIMLSLSIRMTRKELFHLDTQDILVLLVLLAASFLVVSFDGNSLLLNAAIRVSVMLYAAEFIINRCEKVVVSKVFSFAVFFIIGVKSFF